MLQLFRRFTYVTTHSPTLLLLHLRLLVLQPFRHFTYVTTHSPTLLLLHLRLLVLQPFSSLHLRHNSFSNPSVASPKSEFILQPFFRFSTSQAFHLIHLASRPWRPGFNTVSSEDISSGSRLAYENCFY